MGYEARCGRWEDEEISDHIYEGALAFLRAEYKLLSIFVLIVSALLFMVSTIVETTHWMIVIAFVFGAVFLLCW